MNSNYFDYFKSFIGTVSSSAIVAYLAPKISLFQTSGMTPAVICSGGEGELSFCRNGFVGLPRFCLEKISWLQPLKKNLATQGYQVNYFSYKAAVMLSGRPDNLLGVLFAGAGEEFYCRGLVQKVFLRDLPKRILKKISLPNEWLDSRIWTGLRIACASCLFAGLHTDYWNCEKGGAMPQLFGGMVFGLLAEMKMGLVASALAHGVANYWMGILSR